KNTDENSAVAETLRPSEEETENNIENSSKSTSTKNPDSEVLIADSDEEENQKEKDSITETAIANLEKESIIEEEEEIEIENTQKSKLSLSTFAAPVVYSNFGGGSAIDPQFSANPSNSNLTMAYGVNVGYQVAKRFKIRTGIGKVAMSYDIQDVMFSAAIIPNAIASIDYSPEGNNYQIQGQGNRDSYSNVESSFAPQSASRSRLGELNQQFGYIEIPLELEYKLIDKRLGLNIIGGGSSLILDENKLLLNSNNQSATLGKANNINDLSFSTNIGLGLDYDLNERIKLNLEPIFKYQINTFENTQNLQPYHFGIYSGLSYKF
ncbi:outer membrane beta-barrel protein, partial [Salegentibacter sp.]|uniref:outer membrane beta-barrel protein n=1 Tax=Salegentibacter sp. TaxID=1903072 RepID=UPI0035651F43